MKLSWVGRQLTAILLLAVVLVVVSGAIELIGAVRQATRQADIESDLVAGSVRRAIVEIASEGELRTAEEIASDPRLQVVLMDALVLAPSILHVAVLSPEGVVLAHTQHSRIGEVETPYPPLREVRGVKDALRVLWQLRRTPPTYQKETPPVIPAKPDAQSRP